MQDLRDGLHLPPMSSKRPDSSPPRKKQAAKRRRRPAGKSSRKEEAAEGLNSLDTEAAEPTAVQADDDLADAHQPATSDRGKMPEQPPAAAVKTKDSPPSPAGKEVHAEPGKARSKRGRGGGRSEGGSGRTGPSPKLEDPRETNSRRRQTVEVDLGLLDSRAWDIFRNELQEVGGVLINDAEAQEIATRSFTLARIFLVEKARQEAKEAAR